MDETKTVLLTIIRAMVDYPNEVIIDAQEDELGYQVSIKIDSMDMGRVIGVGGETIRAIRTIFKAISYKQKKSIIIKLEN
jgi:predicted RNA-binding protein YlqC (UPF0109 family)